MIRKEGYYWCKISGHWFIFTWYKNWYDGKENTYHDDDFEEIDERRIEREVNESTQCKCKMRTLPNGNIQITICTKCIEFNKLHQVKDL